MKKQIISKDEIGLNIVILSNEEIGFVVKGFSKCHPDDTYNRDLGIKIANTKAWIKYYEKLKKVIAENTKDAVELKGLLETWIENDNAQIAHADLKLKELKAEYAEIVDEI